MLSNCYVVISIRLEHHGQVPDGGGSIAEHEEGDEHCREIVKNVIDGKKDNTYPANAEGKSDVLATFTFTRKLDPGGKDATEIVTGVEEKEARDGGEVDVRPDIIRIVTIGEISMTLG